MKHGWNERIIAFLLMCLVALGLWKVYLRNQLLSALPRACGDFKNWEEADAYFKKYHARRLDHNGNGIPCESLLKQQGA